MNIAIVGAGAIGGTVGAYLARVGMPVTLVDRDEDHVHAMNRRGLTITGAEDFTVPVHATTPEAIDGPLDTVFLAVKAHHTADAVRAIEHHLTPQSSIVSFQNGLCEGIIANMVGTQHTVGCFVNFSADYLEPGKILYAGHGTVYLGELDGQMTPRLTHLQATLAPWGEILLTDNIWGYLWGKVAYGNMLMATALADETMADVVDRYRPLMLELANEVYRVADREVIRVEAFDHLEPAPLFPARTARPGGNSPHV